jgi:hypothetical protein
VNCIFTPKTSALTPRTDKFDPSLRHTLQATTRKRFQQTPPATSESKIMRIFIGLTDVANITANYAKGFRALGHEVFTAVWNRSYFYPDEQYDIVIDNRQAGTEKKNNIVDLVRMGTQMAKLARALTCDTFILYAPAVLPSHIYYPVLKSFRKEIITAFWGSDARYWYAFAQEMKELETANEVAPFFEYVRTRSGGSYWDKLRTLRTAERYSSLILSQPDCAQLQTRPYMRTHVPLDLSQYEANIPGRTKPLILHAPSVPEAKGTDTVLRVIAELQNEGLQFEFQKIERLANRELRKLLSHADIVVDELYSATIGGLSAEAMACGNAVLVRYMPEYSKVPLPCPALNTNVFTLKDNLRNMIVNIPQRTALARRGRPYVEATNDHIKVCREILVALENKDSSTWDFYPTFHKSLNIPPEILETEKRETRLRRASLFRSLLSTGTTKKDQA